MYVTRNLPDYPVVAFEKFAPPEDNPAPVNAIRPFGAGMPDVEAFPHKVWARQLDATATSATSGMYGHVDPLGWWSLRGAIASHLAIWRHLPCSASHIVITSGLGEALGLFAAIALRGGDNVFVEDPGHHVLRSTLRQLGMRVTVSRVDQEGFDITRAVRNGADAKAAVVTPSRHFPLGMTLPLSRRLSLLSWASTSDSYILEDDFDGEFRYQGTPLPAMMSLDSTGCVIYVGSFSKVMFPGLRLGYMVLPPDLVASARGYIEASGTRAALVSQPAMARFIESGGFATHLRKMRRLYAARQACLCTALTEHASDLFHVYPEQAGMHITACFTAALQEKLSDDRAAQLASARGIDVKALSTYFDQDADLQGLILGYAAFKEDTIRQSVRTLVAVLRNAIS